MCICYDLAFVFGQSQMDEFSVMYLRAVIYLQLFLLCFNGEYIIISTCNLLYVTHTFVIVPGNTYRDILHCNKHPFYLKGNEEDSSIMDAYIMHAVSVDFCWHFYCTQCDHKLFGLDFFFSFCNDVCFFSWIIFIRLEISSLKMMHG